MVGHMDRERNNETQTRREEYTTLLSTIQYNKIQYNTIHYATIQYSTVQCSTVQYSTVQYTTIQYNSSLARTYRTASLRARSGEAGIMGSRHVVGSTFKCHAPPSEK